MPIGIQERHERDNFDDFLDQKAQKFVDVLKEEREVIQEPNIPEPEPEPMTPADELPAIDEPLPDPTLEKKKMEVAMIPAETIVDVIDTTAISVNSYIAQEHQDGASPEEKESLQHAVANYLRETDIDISPGKLCLILIVMIYAPKVLQAFQTRKLNQENAALRQRNAILEQQLREREASDGQVSGV